MSYFIIGALKESNLKIAGIGELKGWFVDNRRKGYQIDGITESSGNVPTGYGTGERRNEFIATPEELVTRYQDVLENPNRTTALRGDMTAMVSFTTLLYTNQEKEGLLKQFNTKKSVKQKSSLRLKIDQEMLEKDLERYVFAPEYDVYSSGFSLNVKQFIYRFPSIVIQDTAIITETGQMDSWETLDYWLQGAEGSDTCNSLANGLLSLLAVAYYTRLRCYLHMNSGESLFRVLQSGDIDNEVPIADRRILQFEVNSKVWEMTREEFFDLAKLIVNLQQHLIARQTNGFSKKQFRSIFSAPVESSGHSELLARFFSCEWCLVLMEIPGVTDQVQNLSGSISFKTRVRNAIAFSYQQCRLHTEALEWYRFVRETSYTLQKKQLISVYRGIARCQVERNELSEADTAFQEALKMCGVQDIDTKTAVELTNGIECVDFGMVLLEAGCFYYKTERNHSRALLLLFRAMEQLILSAANVKENTCNLLAGFETLTYSKRLMFASNPSRPLAHCLFALSGLLKTVDKKYATQYHQQAYKLGLIMVIDEDTDDIQKASILEDLGKQTRMLKYLESALFMLKRRVSNYDASDIKCEALLNIGELAASKGSLQDDYSDLEQIAEENEFNELMTMLDADVELLVDQGQNWTETQISDWYSKTTQALDEAYHQRKYHISQGNAHKIHGDLLTPHNTDKAMGSYEEAKKAFRAVGSKLNAAMVTIKQANVLKKVSGKGEIAEQLFSEAQVDLQSVFKDQMSNSLLVKVKLDRAGNLRSLGRNTDADKLTEEAKKMQTDIEKGKADLKTELKSANEDSLLKTEHAITDSESVTIPADDSALSDEPKSSIKPTSIRLVREVHAVDCCYSVCNYKNSTYVSLRNGDVVSIGANYKFTPLAKLDHMVEGLNIHEGRVYMACDEHDGYPNKTSVHVHELSTGNPLNTWTQEGEKRTSTVSLTVVGGKLVITTEVNERLGLRVYSATGQLIKRISCDALWSAWVSSCSADNSSIIVSLHNTNTVQRINVDSGQLMWTNSDIVNPMGVTCYKQYVLVHESSAKTQIHILDISTGIHVGSLVDSRKWSDVKVLDADLVFSLDTAGDTLIVPRFDDKKVLFYKLD